MGVCFFKQKTAYEMRISDWSSDVCSSDLIGGSIGVAILVSQFVNMKRSSHAVLAEGIGPYSETLHHMPLPDAWSLTGAAGAMSLNAEEIGRASCREGVCQYV